MHFGGDGGVGGLHDKTGFGARTNTAAALNTLEAVDRPAALSFVHLNGIARARLLANAAENAFLHINGYMTFESRCCFLLLYGVLNGFGLLEKTPEGHAPQLKTSHADTLPFSAANARVDGEYDHVNVGKITSG